MCCIIVKNNNGGTQTGRGFPDLFRSDSGPAPVAERGGDAGVEPPQQDNRVGSGGLLADLVLPAAGQQKPALRQEQPAKHPLLREDPLVAGQPLPPERFQLGDAQQPLEQPIEEKLERLERLLGRQEVPQSLARRNLIANLESFQKMLTQNQEKLEGLTRNGTPALNTSANGLSMRRY